VTVRDERFERLLGPAAPLFAAAFDALPDAIGIVWPVTDATGAFVDFEVGYTNPSSERMMGVPLRDEVGARLREAMPGLVAMGLYDRLVRVAATGEAEWAEITLDTMERDAIHVNGVWVHTVLPFGSGLMSVAFDVSASDGASRSCATSRPLRPMTCASPSSASTGWPACSAGRLAW